MPAISAATETTLTQHDIDNMKDEDDKITRESAERWILLHSGDFQSITDWRADIELSDGTNLIFDWAKEDSEMYYNNCMYGNEDA